LGAKSQSQLKQLIREFALNKSEITDVVGQSVFGVHLQDADAATVLQAGPIIVFEMIGGDLRWTGAVAVTTVEIYGYSKRSLAEATRAYDVWCEIMQHERLAIDGIDSTAVSREVQRPLDGYNQVLEAWYVRGRWAFEVV
jgi:hypothetical protein